MLTLTEAQNKMIQKFSTLVNYWASFGISMIYNKITDIKYIINISKHCPIKKSMKQHDLGISTDNRQGFRLDVLYSSYNETSVFVCLIYVYVILY